MKLEDIITNDAFCLNINPDYNEVDQFICSKCGIHLQEWIKVEDEEDGWYSEYEFKYCPNCGRKIMEVN